MTQQQFDDGYKLLTRFFKDTGRYNDFIKITVQHNRKFKQKLKDQFDIWENRPEVGNWNAFFTYQFFVGEKWRDYNDLPSLNNLRKQWQNFLIEKNFDGLNYIK